MEKNFFLQDRKSFQIWKFIRVMEVGNEMQNFSLICSKLCLLGQKNTGIWGLNKFIVLLI